MSDKKISILIDRMVPDYLVSEYPQYHLFLKKFLEFIEQTNSSYDIIANLLDYVDVDKTIAELEIRFYNDFLKKFPTALTTNVDLLVKQIRNFYKYKGTETSYKFLFHALYGQDINIYYPKVNILKTDDGSWSDNTYIIFEDKNGNIPALRLLSNENGGIDGYGTLTFDATTKTITRDNRSFQSPVNGQIIVSGSVSNDGTYTVTGTSNLVLTVAETIIDETTSACSILLYTQYFFNENDMLYGVTSGAMAPIDTTERRYYLGTSQDEESVIVSEITGNFIPSEMVTVNNDNLILNGSFRLDHDRWTTDYENNTNVSTSILTQTRTAIVSPPDITLNQSVTVKESTQYDLHYELVSKDSDGAVIMVSSDPSIIDGNILNSFELPAGKGILHFTTGVGLTSITISLINKTTTSGDTVKWDSIALMESDKFIPELYITNKSGYSGVFKNNIDERNLYTDTNITTSVFIDNKRDSLSTIGEINGDMWWNSNIIPSINSTHFNSLVWDTSAVEYVTNGTFDIDISGWNDHSVGTGSSSWVVVSGITELQLSSVDSANFGYVISDFIPLTNNIQYVYSFYTDTTDTKIKIGSTPGGSEYVDDTVTSTGTFIVSGGGCYISLYNSRLTTNIDNISIKKRYDTLTRTVGSWTDNGFIVGRSFVSDSIINPGTYEIFGVPSDTILEISKNSPINVYSGDFSTSLTLQNIGNKGLSKKFTQSKLSIPWNSNLATTGRKAKINYRGSDKGTFDIDGIFGNDLLINVKDWNLVLSLGGTFILDNYSTSDDNFGTLTFGTDYITRTVGTWNNYKSEIIIFGSSSHDGTYTVKNFENSTSTTSISDKQKLVLNQSGLTPGIDNPITVINRIFNNVPTPSLIRQGGWGGVQVGDSLDIKNSETTVSGVRITSNGKYTVTSINETQLFINREINKQISPNNNIIIDVYRQDIKPIFDDRFNRMVQVGNPDKFINSNGIAIYRPDSSNYFYENPNAEIISLGTGNWRISAWIRFRDNTSNPGFILTNSSGSIVFKCYVHLNDGVRITPSMATGDFYIVDGFYHKIEIVSRSTDATYYYLFIDGVQVGSSNTKSDITDPTMELKSLGSGDIALLHLDSNSNNSTEDIFNDYLNERHLFGANTNTNSYLSNAISVPTNEISNTDIAGSLSEIGKINKVKSKDDNIIYSGFSTSNYLKNNFIRETQILLPYMFYWRMSGWFSVLNNTLNETVLSIESFSANASAKDYNGKISILINPTGNIVFEMIGLDAAVDISSTYTGSDIINDGLWHKYNIYQDSLTTAKLYLDGVFLSIVQLPHNINDSTVVRTLFYGIKSDLTEPLITGKTSLNQIWYPENYSAGWHGPAVTKPSDTNIDYDFTMERLLFLENNISTSNIIGSTTVIKTINNIDLFSGFSTSNYVQDFSNTFRNLTTTWYFGGWFSTTGNTETIFSLGSYTTLSGWSGSGLSVSVNAIGKLEVVLTNDGFVTTDTLTSVLTINSSAIYHKYDLYRDNIGDVQLYIDGVFDNNLTPVNAPGSLSNSSATLLYGLNQTSTLPFSGTLSNNQYRTAYFDILKISRAFNVENMLYNIEDDYNLNMTVHGGLTNIINPAGYHVFGNFSNSNYLHHTTSADFNNLGTGNFKFHGWFKFYDSNPGNIIFIHGTSLLMALNYSFGNMHFVLTTPAGSITWAGAGNKENNIWHSYTIESTSDSFILYLDGNPQQIFNKISTGMTGSLSDPTAELFYGIHYSLVDPWRGELAYNTISLNSSYTDNELSIYNYNLEFPNFADLMKVDIIDEQAFESYFLLSPNGITYTTNSITRVDGSWIDDGISIGDYLEFENAFNSGNNQTVHVTGVTAVTITTDNIMVPDTNDIVVNVFRNSYLNKPILGEISGATATVQHYNKNAKNILGTLYDRLDLSVTSGKLHTSEDIIINEKYKANIIESKYGNWQPNRIYQLYDSVNQDSFWYYAQTSGTSSSGTKLQNDANIIWSPINNSVWTDSKGQLSSDMYLQDNYYYQIFSYEIQTGVQKGEYNNVVQDQVHPSGMLMFGQIHNLNPGFVSENALNVYGTFIVEPFNFTTENVSLISNYRFIRMLKSKISPYWDGIKVNFNNSIQDSTGLTFSYFQTYREDVAQNATWNITTVEDLPINLFDSSYAYNRLNDTFVYTQRNNLTII